ncbi:hypothetical protein BDY19DRAFT_903565 [Irpex rosettiformis]|uniref:Uncharacterized protein n=1 Tax=Irpex rosettiformis TaxID=378272 RepID=A0ACB8UEY9_9APHY|nr:hypothetical protein BDY19DRAFT_903565 [Irpex rosettiformis]
MSSSGRTRCKCFECLARCPDGIFQTAATILRHKKREETQAREDLLDEPLQHKQRTLPVPPEHSYQELSERDAVSESMPEDFGHFGEGFDSENDDIGVQEPRGSQEDGDAEDWHGEDPFLDPPTDFGGRNGHSRSPTPSDGDFSNAQPEDDPVYINLDQLFNDREQPPRHNDIDDMEELPPAFYEHPTLRNIYLRVFLDATFNHSTQESIRFQLETLYETLKEREVSGAEPIPNLENMARTLRTVERRLGVDPDKYIVYYFLCDVCWARHHPSELNELKTPLCEKDECTGRLWSAKRLRKGITRIPNKVLATCPIVPQIRRILMRPGKFEELQHWRTYHDDPGPAAPETHEQFKESLDPNRPLNDVYDGWAWRAAQAGLERRTGTGEWGVEDLDAKNLNQQFVRLPNGILAMVNIDWRVSNAVHTNEDQQVQRTLFMRRNLNAVIEPFVCDMIEIYYGLDMKVHGHEEPVLTHLQLLINSSDLPATRKLLGLRSHSSKDFMCTRCCQTIDSLTHEDCFDPAKFRLRKDWRYLKYKFQARDADADRREEIADIKGVRWSALDLLPGWLPAQNSPLEFMHSTFLGEIHHVMQEIIVGGGMLTARNRKNKPKEKLRKFLADVEWPGSIGRVPSKVDEGSLKADQWRNLVNVLPVALYCAWEVDGEIPNQDAPRPKATTKASKAESKKESLLKARRQGQRAHDPNVSIADLVDSDDEFVLKEDKAKMSRNYADHYNCVLDLATAILIYASHSLTPNEIDRAAKSHSRACRNWARMNCHLTPNFHLSEHHPEFFLAYGPPYGYWGYPMERHNGFLKSFTHNGHGRGELETTLMRQWLKYSLIADLIISLEGLEDPTPADESIIDTLKTYLGKGGKGTTRRNTMMNSLASRCHTLDGIIEFPQRSQQINLKLPGIIPGHENHDTYTLVLRHLQGIWGDVLNLVPDTAPAHLGEPLAKKSVRSYDYVTFNGLRYGSSIKNAGRKYRNAYIDMRQPVRIILVLRIKHVRNDADLPPLEHTCAIVQRFVRDPHTPAMPWDLQSRNSNVARS